MVMLVLSGIAIVQQVAPVHADVVSTWTGTVDYTNVNENMAAFSGVTIIVTGRDTFEFNVSSTGIITGTDSGQYSLAISGSYSNGGYNCVVSKDLPEAETMD